MSAAHEALERTLASRESEAQAFLAELVKVPSDTPPGDNAAHARRAGEIAREHFDSARVLPRLLEIACG